MKNKSSEVSLFFSITFDFLELYLPKQAGRSQKTIKSYRDALTVFRRYLYEEKKISISEFKFTDCNRECILDFILYLKRKGNSPGTCNHRLTTIKTYVWYAADKDITLQPLALSLGRIPKCKTPKMDKEKLSETELSALLKQPANTKIGLRDRVIMILLYDSAIRLSEELDLTLHNLNLNKDNPYIRVKGKGNKERVVAITTKTAQHLQVYISQYHKNTGNRDEYLFYTVINGVANRMSPGNVERLLQKYADEAREAYPEMPKKVYPHMLRRTRATDLYQSGVELELVSRILGHASTETTKMYAKPSIEMLRKAMESVNPPEQTFEKPLWVGNEEEIARICGIR